MVFQIAAPFLQAAAVPSLTAGAAAAAGSAGLTIGGAGAAALAPGAGAALGAASQGFKGAASGLAGGGKGFVEALLGSPKGLAAFGKGLSSIGQVAGMMIGGEKGRKVAQSAGMFGMIAGLAPDLAKTIGSFMDPKTGTAAAGGLVGSNLEQLGINPNQTFNYGPT